jgi:hypothetical protein
MQIQVPGGSDTAVLAGEDLAVGMDIRLLHGAGRVDSQ